MLWDHAAGGGGRVKTISNIVHTRDMPLKPLPLKGTIICIKYTLIKGTIICIKYTLKGDKIFEP